MENSFITKKKNIIARTARESLIKAVIKAVWVEEDSVVNKAVDSAVNNNKADSAATNKEDLVVNNKVVWEVDSAVNNKVA